MSKHQKEWTELGREYDKFCSDCNPGQHGHKFPQHRAEGPAE